MLDIHFSTVNYICLRSFTLAGQFVPKEKSQKADIIFTRGNLNEAELFTMKADGSDITPLTDNDMLDVEPVWGDKGKIVVFESLRGAGSDGIYKLDLRGRGGTTEVIDTEHRDAFPDVSPDGEKVVFASLLGSDRTGPIRLTKNAFNDRNPVISPDATQIAFSSDRNEDGVVEIYIMDADGNNVTQLTDPAMAGADGDGYPTWSPDGTQIGFVRFFDS